MFVEQLAPAFDLLRIRRTEQRRLVARLRHTVLSLPVQQQPEAIARVMEEYQRPLREQKTRIMKLVGDIRCRARLFCLSEPSTCPLMWAHYGEVHQGVAIGFSTPILENGWRCCFEKVRYAPSLPSLIDPQRWLNMLFFGHSTPQWGNGRQWALYKHTRWEYEREWRIVSIEPPGTRGLYKDVQLPGGAVTEIILGTRASTSLQRELKDIQRHAYRDCRVLKAIDYQQGKDFGIRVADL